MATFDDEPKRNSSRMKSDRSGAAGRRIVERIGILRDEIARLEAELKSKGTTKSAAEALFRRG